MRFNRKQQRSSKRSDEGADDVVLDDPVAEFGDGGAGSSTLDSDDLDLAAPVDTGDGLEDLDDAPVRSGSRGAGDTMLGDRVARPRPTPTGPDRGRVRPRQFLHEVNVELRKVAWPTRRETINYSSVVLVTLSVLMALIFGLDYGFNRLSIYLFK